MAKVLFINPVIRQEDNPKHVPYGMALLAAIADRDGHQVQVFDANAWRLGDEYLIQALGADEWDVVATGAITTSYGHIKRIVRLAKEHAPDAVVVAGGGFITSMPRDIMAWLPEIDVGVIGEAFVTFPEILSKVDAGDRNWGDVLGVAYRDGDRTVLTRGRPLISREELDSLPFPGWGFFPLDIYWRNSSLLYSEEAFSSKRRLDINASYGCSLICRFCYHLGISGDLSYVDGPDGGDVEFTYDRNIRWHSARYVIDLVKHARDEFGVDFVLFFDENLMTMNAYSRWKWLPEIADLWIAEGLQPQCRRDGVPHDPDKCDGVHWGGTSHATLIKPDLLKKLHESGCSQLLYGYESFSDRILKNLGKGTTAATNERSLNMTMDAGIRPIPNQMIGFPDEFFDSIRDSVRAWQRMNIQVEPFFSTPYPGSEWYYTYKEKILEQYDGDLEAFILDLGDASRVTAVISENFNAVELLGLRELMMQHDLKRIDEYEKVWREVNGEPFLPDFVHNPRQPVVKPQLSVKGS